MGSEDLIFFQIKSKHKMLSVKLITLVLSMAMFSHGKAAQQCNSCCPTPTPPDEDAITCDKLGEHLDKLDDAIAEGSCDEVEGQQSDAVCNEFTKAIPPCMVLNGGVKQSECLAEKASELGEEEIVTNCKCKAFRNIRNTVGSVKNMMCVDSRESRNFGHGYGMNTIWFQYLLCKDLGIACYFFTQGWNQGDFGQYYLYDNLLDSSTGISDDTLLTLAVVGGLGGGYRPQYAPAHGHYYPPPPEPEPVTAFFPFSFSAEAADWEALMGRVLTRSYFLCLEDARRSIRPVPRLLMLTPTQPKNAVLILALVVMGISVICAVHVTDLSHQPRKQDVKE